jgi:glycosyltransferase involved in cell wall biosynthesis
MDPAPLRLLCIEPRFPGRLGTIADWLVRCRGHRCQFYCHKADAPEQWPASVGKGLDVVRYSVGGIARGAAVPWTRDLERGLCHAYGCWEVLEARRPRGIDLVLGRSAGLGAALFAPAALPHVPIVTLFDYFYAAHRHDLAEEAGPDTPVEYFHWRRAANAMTLLELESSALCWLPTAWQRELFPPPYRDGFLVLSDGVDTRQFARRPGTPRVIAGRMVPKGTRVVSFVARCLDRVRGFDRFMKLAGRLMQLMPDMLCVVAGAPQVERGLDVAFYGRDYAAHVLRETPPPDPDRFWFLGAVPRSVVAEILAATDLHVYPSRSFPVARSLLEAMACGAVVLAWDTPAVREFIDHGKTGLLVPPGDEEAPVWLARAVLRNPAAHRPVGTAAAQRIRERYAQDVVLPELARHLARLAGRGG